MRSQEAPRCDSRAGQFAVIVSPARELELEGNLRVVASGMATHQFLSDFTRAELIRRMRFVPQVSPFRVGVRYHNMGMILAGEILERVSGKS